MKNRFLSIILSRSEFIIYMLIIKFNIILIKNKIIIHLCTDLYNTIQKIDFFLNNISKLIYMPRDISAILISRETTKSPKIEERKWQFN